MAEKIIGFTSLIMVIFLFGYIILLKIDRALDKLEEMSGGRIKIKRQQPTKQKRPKRSKQIVMDDRKFIVNVSTDSLEKGFDKITPEKTSGEQIGASVNKLKKLKGDNND